MPTTTHSTRAAGVLLHVTSLPGPYGIGDLGPAARAYVDFLHRAGQSWWQVLPLNPAGAGDSPYQAYSSVAGDPRLISPEDLRADELLAPGDLRELARAARSKTPTRANFAAARLKATDLLARAAERLGANRKLAGAFDAFVDEHRGWLDDYALFMALRAAAPETAWQNWPREVVLREPAALAAARERHADAVRLHQVGQFLFFRQLDALRARMRERNVRLIGDVPIYVSPDSADVWAHPDLFLLDARRRPTAVAGVPPDYFSATGQRWGNPLYDWGAMRRSDFQWWVDRAAATLRQVDLVRIDHFRGFAGFWRIPASAPTAQKGKWVKAPGTELFEALTTALSANGATGRARLRPSRGGTPRAEVLPFIAEDLGVITPDVERLRDAFRLPGMRVLQFAFDGTGANAFLPHNYVPNAVAYTGTHDNDTTAGWFESLDAKTKRFVRDYLGEVTAGTVAREMTAAVWRSVANLAVTPVQDLLNLGSDARMNTPGVASGNWSWRLTDRQLTPKLADRLAALTRATGRAPV